MFVKTIVCSGINEKNNIQEAVAFLKSYSSVEFGVQCSPKKAGRGSERLDWLEALTAKLDEEKLPNRIALHLNEGFVVSFCNGIVPPEISSLLDQTSAIGRLQLNFKIGREVFEDGQALPNIEKLKQAIGQTSKHNIILSASKPNLPLISKMHHQGMKFDVLFDDSFGEGILPEKRQEQLFDDVFHGYAGGLSDENVLQELEKISKVAAGSIFIDAEGKLKENGCFCFEKSQKYVSNALYWNAKSLQIRSNQR